MESIDKIVSLLQQILKKISTPTEDYSAFVGKNVFIRTVTMYYVGRVQSFENGLIELRRASWVAETGRWSGSLQTGKLREVEPYPEGLPCFVSPRSVVEILEWKHPLPTAVNPTGRGTRTRKRR